MSAKTDLLKELKVSRMPITLQIQAGKIFDTAFEAGRQQGFSDGVRKGAESAFGKLEEAYDRGMREANEVSSASFLACTAIAVHKLFGFGEKRRQRLIDEVSHMLLTTLHPSQWVEECRKLGVVIDALDVLQEWEEGAEDAGEDCISSQC